MPGDTLFRAVLRMRIRPERAAEFERTWHRLFEDTTRDPANIAQSLCRDTEEPGMYHIVSDWTDEPSFRAFEHSEAHRLRRAELAPFQLGRSMSTMRIARHLPGAGAATPDGTVRVLLYMHAPGADAATVEKAYHEIHHDLAGVPGLLRNELLRDVHDPAGHVVVSEWDALASYRAWADSPAHERASGPLRAFHDGRYGVPYRIYEVVGGYR